MREVAPELMQTWRYFEDTILKSKRQTKYKIPKPENIYEGNANFIQHAQNPREEDY